jgi:hypothetical protein
MAMAERDPKDSLPRFIVLGDSQEVEQYLKDHAKEVERSRKKAIRALASLRKELSSGQYGVVTGISVELYHKRGFVVMPPDYGLTVRVESKAPSPEVRAQFPSLDPFRRVSRRKAILEIPREHLGVRVKVVESNPRRAVPIAANLGSNASTTVPPPEETDPLTGGNAVSPQSSDPWGTLGILFRQTDGKLYGVSCKHVISSGAAEQPAFKSSEGAVTRRKIGDTLASKITTRADVALIEILGKSATSAIQGVQQITDQGIEWRILVSQDFNWGTLDRKHVRVFGARTSGAYSPKSPADGQITSVSGSIVVGGKTFYDPLTVQASPRSSTIVDEGDSGSALFYLDSNANVLVWIGIVFAMSDTRELIACRLTSAFKALGIDASDIPATKAWP